MSQPVAALAAAEAQQRATVSQSFDQIEAVLPLDDALLVQLYETGLATLRSGFVHKESFGGLRSWKRRWLELELSLEHYGKRPELAVSLRYYRTAQPRAAQPPSPVEQHADEDAAAHAFSEADAAAAVSEGEDEGRGREHAGSYFGRRWTPLGDVRLTATDDLLSFSSSASSSQSSSQSSRVLALRAGGRAKKLWRVRCTDEPDAAAWRAAFATAFAALRADHRHIAAAIRRASRQNAVSRARGVRTRTSQTLGLVLDLVLLAGDRESARTRFFSLDAERGVLRVLCDAQSLAPAPAFRAPRQSFGALVVVEILEARGLAAADANGLADPYVTAELAGQTLTTRTVRATLEPRWCEALEFWAGACGARAPEHARECGGFAVAADTRLTFKVWHEDLGCEPELMATLELGVSALVAAAVAASDDGAISKPQWYPLLDPNSASVAPGRAGELRLRVTPRLFELKSANSSAASFRANLAALRATNAFLNTRANARGASSLATTLETRGPAAS